ncbi:hypothetical protein PIB30_097937 [Stylosanthes scabra]|uniref:NB-ARC domain-containing protein n=1 Tax=Stylosanthes scabra TaxID=79078 RepID=A0ABU6QXQ4_9FABA|nr:hypothetical protein [Stylosanthes scabra]
MGAHRVAQERKRKLNKQKFDTRELTWFGKKPTRSIAESCNGLPLLIKTIVAKRERSEETWEEIKNLLPYWSISEDKDGKKMMERLMLSYDDLSEEMKPCFFYLGAFLEDEEILVRDLICMWRSS